MKAVKVIPIIVIMFIFLSCKTKLYAGWAQVTAVLPADKKSVASEFVLFQANEMFCCTQPISEYPIKFQAIGRGDVSQAPYVEASITYNVGQSGTVTLARKKNYHQITLKGWDINTAVKGCIGYGYITD